MTWSATDVIVGVIVVAGIYLLVRPGSPGVDFVTSITSALSATVKTAADL